MQLPPLLPTFTRAPPAARTAKEDDRVGLKSKSPWPPFRGRHRRRRRLFTAPSSQTPIPVNTSRPAASQPASKSKARGRSASRARAKEAAEGPEAPGLLLLLLLRSCRPGANQRALPTAGRPISKGRMLWYMRGCSLPLPLRLRGARRGPPVPPFEMLRCSKKRPAWRTDGLACC